MRRILLALLALLTLGGVVAACGDDGGGDDDATEESEPEIQPADTGDDAEEAAGPATVSVASTGIGDVLVGPDGKTLYLYASDMGTTSAVPANVLAAWPPLMVASEGELVAGEGIDESLLGTAPQPDGTIWVTYNGHLLYGFSGDGAAGDTNGHKLGSIWFALTPAGEQAP